MSEAVSMDSIFQELKRIEEKMATREDIEALADSLEILGNSATMHRIEESEKAIAEGKVKRITTVKDMLHELGE